MDDEAEKPVNQMTYWEIISEIDANYFCLEQMYGQIARRSPIDKMIDKSTGYDKELEATFKAYVARIKELQAALPPDDPHFAKDDGNAKN